MKAALLEQGFSSHREIWSDQPPVLPWLLQAWFKLGGHSVANSRVMIILLSGILVWHLSKIIIQQSSPLASVAVIVLLAFSPAFLRLSMSVMIGLPAFAIALVAIAILHTPCHVLSNSRLAASGCIMAIALQTKLSVVLVIPACIAGICITIHRKDTKASIGTVARQLFFWMMPMGITFTSISYMSDANFTQLIETHVGQATRQAFLHNEDLNWSLANMLRRDTLNISLACVGAACMLWKRNLHVIAPLIWCLTAIAVHLWHRPFWFYHYLHVAIPIAWLAALGVGELWSLLRYNVWSSPDPFTKSGVAALLVTAAVCGVGFTEIIPTFKRTEISLSSLSDPTDRDAVSSIKKYAAHSKWVMTDNPILSFYAGLLVPPEAAVLSYKRIKAGHLSQPDILKMLQKYKPEQVLWSDYSAFEGVVNQYVETHYLSVFANESMRHYVLRGVVEKTTNLLGNGPVQSQ